MPELVTIERRVKEAVSGLIYGGRTEEISKEHSLVEDLGFDSLDIVRLELEIEDQFGITIADKEMERLVTVDHIIGYVIENMPEDPWQEVQG
ncbi:MAG: acyl carrier protein [Mariprofundaceae bacterium]|nr:acyl carrier protein [Mariprofundaceae bacterium]